MPYRLPADLTILNPPTSRNVFSKCALFPYWLHLAVGRLRRPTQRFPKRFPNPFPSVSESAFRRKLSTGTFLARLQDGLSMHNWEQTKG